MAALLGGSLGGLVGGSLALLGGDQARGTGQRKLHMISTSGTRQNHKKSITRSKRKISELRKPKHKYKR
jgi:gas vesicle protein